MNKLQNLNPQNVWKHFEDICFIPHPSKHEKILCEHIIQFAKAHNLVYKNDAVGNIVITKPATAGMEQCETIILQAHLDMVPQKNADTVHDFLRDAIQPRIVGNFVKATHTTLGADNGIGVAVILAILESQTIAHGCIEAFFTIDEETGMTGAKNLQPNVLKGEILINLDSEDEGELYVGCAGGLDGSFTYTYKEEAIPAGHEAYKLSVTGLKGGHSGMDIILYRANANKLMCRFFVLKAGNKRAGRSRRYDRWRQLAQRYPSRGFCNHYR